MEAKRSVMGELALLAAAGLLASTTVACHSDDGMEASGCDENSCDANLCDGKARAGTQGEDELPEG